MLVAHTLNTIEGLVLAYGALGIFLAAFIEEAFIPLASTIVMVMSGFFVMGDAPVTHHTFAVFVTNVVLPVSAGFTMGTLIVFTLFYRYGEKAVKRFGRFIHLRWAEVERFERRFTHKIYDELIVFFSRAVPLFPSAVINAFCGLMKWSPLRFVIITFCGIMVRSAVLGYAGWQLGGYYRAHLDRVTLVQDRVFAFGILFVFAFVSYLYFKKKRYIRSPRS
jgi:membrane protein DedA with SNARE-associated domain